MTQPRLWVAGVSSHLELGLYGLVSNKCLGVQVQMWLGGERYQRQETAYVGARTNKPILVTCGCCKQLS